MNVIKTTDGTHLLRGAYKLKDESGLPLDVIHELCRDQGIQVDWVEVLLDAGRQSVLKFDAVMDEIRLLVPEQVDEVYTLTAALLLKEGGVTPEHFNRVHGRLA